MDPEGETLSAEAAVRQNLQQRLLDAVKQARQRAAGGDREEVETVDALDCRDGDSRIPSS